MTLFADLDWASITGAALTAFGTAATTIGAGVAFLLKHLAGQRQAQRDHESAIMTRVDGISSGFADTVRSLAKDSREENRRTVTTLLEIQKDTVEAIGGLSARVGELGTAISSLQTEMHRKADRLDGPKRGSGEHRALPGEQP